MVKKTKHGTTNYKRLLPFVKAAEEHDGAAVFRSEGYMDLHVEWVGYDEENRKVYSMAHYGKQNGDLMADPDMTFAMAENEGIANPRSFQNDYSPFQSYRYQEVFSTSEDGRLLYSPRLLKDLDEFLYSWLNNIDQQGFLKKGAEAV